MAFKFKSTIYNNTGRASFSMSAQHHQLPCFNPKNISTPIPFSNDGFNLTNLQSICQEIFEFSPLSHVMPDSRIVSQAVATLKRCGLQTLEQPRRHWHVPSRPWVESDHRRHSELCKATENGPLWKTVKELEVSQSPMDRGMNDTMDPCEINHNTTSIPVICHSLEK